MFGTRPGVINSLSRVFLQWFDFFKSVNIYKIHKEISQKAY